MSILKLTTPRHKVAAISIFVLLYNLCAHAKKHGSLDANSSLDELINTLTSFEVHLPEAIIESALYACNMLAEENSFWHPLDLTFDQFVANVIKHSNKKFNKTYNYLED